MLAFYMDHQVRGRITRGLQQRGIDVLTAFEDGRSKLPDDDLLKRASSLKRVFVAQDQDLLRLGRMQQRTGPEFYEIAFVKQEPVNVNKVVEYLELVAHILSEEEMHNHIEYVPSR